MNKSVPIVGFLALVIAATRCQSPTAMQPFQRAASEQSQTTEHLNARLRGAAYKGDVATVRALCDRGAQVDAPDAAGNTALMFASQGGHTDVAKLLLRKGAKPNVRSSIGATALMYASQYGCETVAKALLDAGADVNLRHQQGGSSPLMIASLGGHTKIVELLLRNRAQLLTIE